MILQKNLTHAPNLLVKKLYQANSFVPGLLLLCIAMAFGYLLRYVGYFMQDEGGNIAIGYLISKGDILYRDIFTHHFPFPYYWIAGVLSLRRSIQVVRLSVLLFQMGAFATIMGLTRAYLAVGLTAFVWNILAPYYYGNQAIYPTFAGLSLLVIFAVTLVVISQKRALTRAETLAWGVFAAIALLSNPLSALALGVSVLALWINSPSRARIAWGVFLVMAIVASVLAYFWAAGAVPALYASAFEFNLNIYNRYVFEKEFSVLQAVRMAVEASLFGHNEWQQALKLLPLQSFPLFIIILLGGLLYRITAGVIILALLLNRRWLLAAFFYAFTAAVIFRSEEFYRQVPFILVSLLSIAWLILGVLNGNWSPFLSIPQDHRVVRPASNPLMLRGLQLTTALFAGALLFLLVGQSLVHRFTHLPDLAFTANFRNYYLQASEIQKLACGQPARLGVYPGDSMLYFYTGLEPIAGYPYFFPWVAEDGLTRVLESVKTEPAIVWIDQEVSIWGIPVKNYLGDLLAYLDQHYVRVKDYYVSPQLYNTCAP